MRFITTFYGCDVYMSYICISKQDRSGGGGQRGQFVPCRLKRAPKSTIEAKTVWAALFCILLEYQPFLIDNCA